MKIQELRLGNYVYDDEDVVVQVRMLLDQSYKDYDVGTPVLFSKEGDSETLYYSDIKAIPLTAEWLEKLGFDFDGYTYDKGKLSINLKSADRPKGRVYYNSWAISDKRPEYVHQLQNLFFCLSGEELTIKENKI